MIDILALSICMCIIIVSNSGPECVCLQVCLCVYVHRFHVRHNCQLHCRFSRPDWRHTHCVLTDVNHLHYRASHKEDDKHTLCNSCRPITASRHKIVTKGHFLINA